MSELKATTSGEIRTRYDLLGYWWYKQSEADKVIAELEERHKMEVEQLLIEIAELQKQVRDYAQGLYVIQARAEKEARHHKYKRCLDKAELCRLEQERIELIENQDITDDDFDKLAKGFYKKWRERWLKIAEKFKETK